MFVKARVSQTFMLAYKFIQRDTVNKKAPPERGATV